MTLCRVPTLIVLCVLAFCAISDVRADEGLESRIQALAEGGFKERAAAVEALAATGNSAAIPALQALAAGSLYTRKSDGAVVIAEKEGKEFHLSDPVSGQSLGSVGRRAAKKIKVNNRLRGLIRTSLGGLQLRADSSADRLVAALAVLKSQDPEFVPLLDAAIAAERDDDVARAMREARAAAILNSDESNDKKRDAIAVLAARADRQARSILLAFAEDANGPLQADALAEVKRIDSTLALWSAVQNVWYGLSLGSVLLLAAIGLAITFGVMRVINMAHGEMVMLGAYTAFVVQHVLSTHFPALFEFSLVVAIPLAFLVAGAVGAAIERCVIRYLYGRPLETLLATWGISLVLQQSVRSVFGPTNQEVSTPAFMSGAFQLGQITITYNRLFILVFALLVFAALLLVLRRTTFGLQMRAVTQNRSMAGAMGIRTDWVDALTFGLGSGIAGIAGVALSQIDNVSPNLGQSYIIDSFMVVVFGGVGNLWGTLVAATTLGVANKFLEPYAGAVLGKIAVLVFIILFIQKRPSGLFALRGRAAEA